MMRLRKRPDAAAKAAITRQYHLYEYMKHILSHGFMKSLIPILTTLLIVVGCHSSKHVADSMTPVNTPSAHANAKAEAMDLVNRITKQQVGKEYITSKVKVQISGIGKDLSVSGQLQMKRDDVIRLSLRFLGMEVGLLEFTPQDVLVLDRIHKQYVRAAYNEIGFLKVAQLDFYALQALFWNELFIPGERRIGGSAGRFNLQHTDVGTQLCLTDAPRLNYTFFTGGKTPQIQRLQVKGRRAGDRGELDWSYSDFRPFGGRQFPTGMAMQVKDTGKDLGLKLTLNTLQNDAGWNTRTTVSSKYKRCTVAQALSGLKL